MTDVAAEQAFKNRLRSAIALDRDLPSGSEAFERFRAGEDIDWSSLEDAAVALFNRRIQRRQWGLVSSSCGSLAEMAALRGDSDLAVHYGLFRLTIMSAGPRNGGGWQRGQYDIPPAAVQQVVGYFERPAWLLVMKVMAEAVELVASWGGEPDYDLVRSELERGMVTRFGPQGAMDPGL